MTKISESLTSFSTPYNYDHEAQAKECNPIIVDRETGEVKPMPSCTVPDQTVSVREIVDRTRKGQIVTGALKGVFNPLDTTPDPRSMDFVERKAAIEKADYELAELKKRQDERSAAKEAKKRKAEQDWKDFVTMRDNMKKVSPDKGDSNTNTP